MLKRLLFTLPAWSALSIVIAVLWWFASGLVILSEDDNYDHPSLDRVLNLLLFPANCLPGWKSWETASRFLLISNCLLWGFILATVCRFVWRRFFLPHFVKYAGTILDNAED